MNRTKEVEYLLWRLCACKPGCALEQTAYAVCLVMEDRTRLAHITKGLYQDVARRFHTDWRNVERNIRSVRDTIWEKGERELLTEISRGRIKKRPTNTMLLQFLTDYLLDREELAQRKTAVSRESIVARITAPHKAANDRAEIARLTVKIRDMEENNKLLTDTVQLLHDLIWDLLQKLKEK